MAKIRISYNAPVVLTFALLATLVQLIAGNDLKSWFVTYPDLSAGAGVRPYLGLITHILGHGDWNHLLSNFTMILLLGPILEERHGSKELLVMILVTALITGVANMLLSNAFLLGASGIVFMMILLASTTNIKRGDIPLTFIAVCVLFLGREVIQAFEDDRISQLAHIIGGLAGGAFGFLYAGNKGGGASGASGASAPGDNSLVAIGQRAKASK